MDATLDADEVDEALTPSVVVPQRLRPPRVRQGQLPRSELISRVQDTDAPVVVVRAAAGYGKSTLLSQLAEADERPSGWLTLHPSDDDPIVLAHHLLRALGTAGLDVAGLGSQLAGAEPQLWRRVVPELATTMDRHTTPFLLILDDTHLLSSTRSWELVDRVVGLVPDGSTVVVSGRAAPHIHRARRAVDGGLIELTQDDLAFTPDESRSFVVANVPTLDNRLVDQLVDVTEGWPVGVDLSILALRTHEDPPLLLSGFLTSDRQLVDYPRRRPGPRRRTGRRCRLRSTREQARRDRGDEPARRWTRHRPNREHDPDGTASRTRSTARPTGAAVAGPEIAGARSGRRASGTRALGAPA